MDFSFDQLQMFTQIVQCGSFSAAARKLGKTQSTVSAAIANLEIDLDVQLFDRSNRNPVLTEAGRRLLIEAEAVLERCHRLEAHAGSLSAGNPPSLTLAVTVPYATVMPVLKAFEAEFPYIDLSLRNPVYGDVRELLLKGEAALGVAFATPSYPAELEFLQLGKLIMVHVACPEHPLAKLAEVCFDELRAERHLNFSAHASKLPTSEYLQATRTWEAENYQALLEMTKAGLGWATLPRKLIQRELEQGELVELQLAAYPHTDWLVGVDLIWHRRHHASPAEHWLRRCFQQHKIFELDKSGQKTTR
jgi:DNA-binding transcriptional LysR family regulator